MWFRLRITMNKGVTSFHAFNGPKNRVIHILNTSKGQGRIFGWCDDTWSYNQAMLTNTRFFLLLEIFCSEKRLRDNWMTCNFQAFKSNMWSFSARLVPRPKKLCTVWNLRNLFLNFPNLHTQVKNPAIVKGGWLKSFTEVVNFQIGRLVLMACDKLKYWFFLCVLMLPSDMKNAWRTKNIQIKAENVYDFWSQANTWA